VYFPFDQAVVTPEGQQVLSEAVTYAGGGHPTRVTIVGHTDTSGSDPDSMALSERRAKAAADALANLGVSRSALSVDWKGKTEPAVQTGDGVPEPLNNRVTIDIAF
jgi:outer membrane protein OmpA-like peptidoglycan-associated protein